MQRALNLARGVVRVEVDCPYPERFVNVCAQNDVAFWRLERVSAATVRVCMHRTGYRRIQQCASGAGFIVRPLERAGVPFFLRRFRRRYVLLLGMALCLLWVSLASMFVWEMHVAGNETVPAAEILTVLEELGVGIGSFGPGIFSEDISNEVLLRIPELSWIAVNVSGSRAHVLVREKVLKPEIVDEKRPTMIYAKKSGVVSRMTVLSGQSVVNAGDTVLGGEVLVSGLMESLSSGTRGVHALAEVYARTWYELSAQMPLQTQRKTYTGGTKKKRSVLIMDKKINFFINSGISYDNYDKIVRDNRLRLPTGNVLPIVFRTEEYAEYTPEVSEMDAAVAEELLQQRLLQRLAALIEDGEAVKTEFTSAVEAGVITVTLHAEFSEQIAAARDFTTDELSAIGADTEEDTAP